MRGMSRPALLASSLLCLALAAPAFAQDDANAAAKKYLDALTGGDASGRDLTFGGATTSVQLETLENYELKGEAKKQESGSLAELQMAIAKLDKAGKSGEEKMLAKAKKGKAGADLEMVEVTPEEMKAINDVTKKEQEAVKKKFPAFAKICRVDKGLYWSPRNPARKLLKEAGRDGQYSLALHIFDVETKSGPRQEPRVFHLKVFRFQAGKVDTGYRILAAADWGAD